MNAVQLHHRKLSRVPKLYERRELRLPPNEMRVVPVDSRIGEQHAICERGEFRHIGKVEQYDHNVLMKPNISCTAVSQ